MLIVGRIKDRTWYGENGMQHVRTVKEPKQPIPTFVETVELLMKVGLLPFQYISLISACFLLHVAREPACQVQRRRQDLERPREIVQAHARNYICSTFMGNGSSTPYPTRTLASKVSAGSDEDIAVLSQVVSRG